MARIRQIQKEITEKYILEASEALFTEYGFNATKTSQIAKKSGVAEGTLYNYFSSKTAILFKIIANKIQQEDLRFIENPCQYVDTELSCVIMNITNSFWGWVSNVKRSFVRYILIESCKKPAINDSFGNSFLAFDIEYIDILKQSISSYKNVSDEELTCQTQIIFSVVITFLQYYALKDDISTESIWKTISERIEYLVQSWE